MYGGYVPRGVRVGAICTHYFSNLSRTMAHSPESLPRLALPPCLPHLITIREPSSDAGVDASVSVSSFPPKRSRTSLWNAVRVSLEDMG